MCTVIMDTAGFGEHLRFTCQEHGKTLLKQPYMTSGRWFEEVSNFSKLHPSKELEEYKTILETLIKKEKWD